MNPLLVATTNPAKLAEYRLLLRDYGLAPVSLAEAGIDDQSGRNRRDLRRERDPQGAILFRASADCRPSPMTAASWSTRWAASPALTLIDGSARRRQDPAWRLDRALVDEVIRRMAGVEPDRRSARLHAAARSSTPKRPHLRARERGRAGGGNRRSRVAANTRRVSVPCGAVLPDRERYLGELSDEDAARLSQRRVALKGLRADLLRIAGAQ